MTNPYKRLDRHGIKDLRQVAKAMKAAFVIDPQKSGHSDAFFLMIRAMIIRQQLKSILDDLKGERGHLNKRQRQRHDKAIERIELAINGGTL